MSVDLEGTAGTPEPSDDQAGTLTPEGTETAGTVGGEPGGPERPEPKTYRVKIGSQERDLTEAEVVSHAQRALGLEVEAEKRNARIRELEAKLNLPPSPAGSAFDEFEALLEEPKAPLGWTGPAYPPTGAAPSPYAPAPTWETTPDGTPTGPPDMMAQAVLALHDEFQALRRDMQRNAKVQVLREQLRQLVDRPDFDKAACADEMKRARAQGVPLDLMRAYYITRGRRLESEVARAETQARRTAGAPAPAAPAVGRMVGAAPQAQAKTIPAERVRGMPQGQYEKLRREGWVVNMADGSLEKA